MQEQPRFEPKDKKEQFDLRELAKIYGLGDLQMTERVQQGSLNENYQLKEDATEKKYFLRKHRPNVEVTSAEKIHEAEVYFSNNGIPIVRALATKDGQYVMEMNGDRISMYPWVEGKSYEAEELSLHAIESIAKVQARIHLLSKDGAPQGLSDRREKGWSIEKFNADLDSYKDLIQQKEVKDEVDELALQEIQLKRDLASRYPFELSSFSLGEEHLIHGDLTHGNIYFDEHDDVEWVFDSEHIQYSPRSLELAKSIDRICLRGEDIEGGLQRVKAFLRAYTEVYPIEKDELEQGIRAYYIRFIYYTWQFREYYSVGNKRVGRFFKYDIEKLNQIRDHLEDTVKQILADLD